VLRALQRALIYYPGATRAPAGATVLPGARDATLHTSDGLELGSWLIGPVASSAREFTVLVANGNAGDRAGRAPLAYALARRGLQVLLFDYRGYGGNRGRPSEAGLARDVRAARRFLVEEAGVAPERLLYLGESLGAAVVTELATEHPPAALVLRSPFSSLAAVGRVHYRFLPVEALLLDRYPVGEQIARVRVPTTVVYGTYDLIVPPEQSIAVARAAAGPARLVAVEGADHNDPELCHGPRLIDAVVERCDAPT
jgi:pimeloyl-ACP methyl ester carboxylesterase